MKSLKPREILKLLQQNNLYIHRQKGSHILLKSKINPMLRVTIPIHNKDLKIKTLLSILKQAGIDKNKI